MEDVYTTGVWHANEQTLSLLAKESVAELEALWTEEFVDRQVRTALDELFVPEPDPAFVRLLRRRRPALGPAELRSALIRLRASPTGEVAGTSPASEPVVEARARRRAPLAAATGGGAAGTPWSKVTLGDLITADFLRPPVELSRRYKSRDLTARIEEDGHVSFDGQLYGSLSIAGAMARKSVIGAPPGRQYPQTNGWIFWQLRDERGELRTVDDVRRRLWETGRGTHDDPQ